MFKFNAFVKNFIGLFSFSIIAIHLISNNIDFISSKNNYPTVVNANTLSYVVYLETTEWWTSGSPSNGNIKIRQVNPNTPSGYLQDMIYVSNSGSNNVFRGTLWSDTTGFQFYVSYGENIAQHYTTYISDLDTVRSSGNRYFKLDPDLHPLSNQTVSSSNGHPSETIVVSKYRENTLLSSETIAKYKTDYNPASISVTDYDFWGWFNDRARVDPVSTVTFFDSDKNIFGDFRPIFNDSVLRIAVVRPSFWKNDNAYQPLRIANTLADLNNHVNENITFFRPVEFINDSYYSIESTPESGFGLYETDGILFYDVFINSIVGKYVDLARYTSTSLTGNLGTPSNWTGTQFQFQNGDNNSIWRIYEDAGAQFIFRPTGLSSESRNISDESVSKLLYAFLTCYDSNNNGYQAFKNLNENFNLLGRTGSTSTLLDYDHTNFTTYESSRDGATTTSLGNKILRLQTQYNSSNSSAPINSQRSFTYQIDFQTNSLTLISTFALTISIAVLYIKKSIKKY